MGGGVTYVLAIFTRGTAPRFVTRGHRTDAHAQKRRRREVLVAPRRLGWRRGRWRSGGGGRCGRYRGRWRQGCGGGRHRGGRRRGAPRRWERRRRGLALEDRVYRTARAAVHDIPHRLVNVETVTLRVVDA